MSEPARPRRLGRSLLALLAGFVVVVVLSLGTDLAMYAGGLFSASGQPGSGVSFLLATAYRTAYGVVGSYVTARLAPDRPMHHALAGGLVGLVLSLVGAVATWNRGPEFGPHWYPLALVALALPQAWLGGALHRRQQA